MESNMKLFLTIALVVFALGNAKNPSPKCSEWPPFMWCDDDAISDSCGVTAQCKAFKAQMKNTCKIQLTLLFESFCGGCREFIRTVLKPLYQEMHSSNLDLKLIPFGNAKVQGDKITCQHGEEECKWNKLESCTIAALGSAKAPLGIFAIEGYIDAAAQPPDFPNSSDQLIATLNHIWKAGRVPIGGTQTMHINNCYYGKLGRQLQLQAANETAAISPEKHQWVPWLLINGASTSHYQMFTGVTPDTLHQELNWMLQQGKCVPPPAQRTTVDIKDW